MTSNKLKAAQKISAGIDLLQLLSSSTEGLSTERASFLLGISEQQVLEVVDMLSQLADSSTGTRVAICVENASIELVGDAAALRPIRLDTEESMVLSHILRELNIDDGLRTRASEALLSPDISDARFKQLAETCSYGSFYQVLTEAIEDGIRCSISYRSANDPMPSGRIIDPNLIVYQNGTGYLDAWDIDKDSERLYRLDRIVSVELTDESCARHPFRNPSIDASLASTGKTVTISLPNEEAARSLGWQGLRKDTLSIDPASGRASIDVSIVDEAWFFNQVLSFGGELVIEHPADMKRRLLAYAKNLLAQQDRL